MSKTLQSYLDAIAPLIVKSQIFSDRLVEGITSDSRQMAKNFISAAVSNYKIECI